MAIEKESIQVFKTKTNGGFSIKWEIHSEPGNGYKGHILKVYVDDVYVGREIFRSQEEITKNYKKFVKRILLDFSKNLSFCVEEFVNANP